MTTTQPTEFEDFDGDRVLYVGGGALRVKLNLDPDVLTFTPKTPEQAQRIALAILTGPGKAGEMVCTGRVAAAAQNLISYFADLDAKAAAEAEAAELEAEALAILNAMYPGNPAPDWADWSAESQGLGITAARAAREARRLHTNKETQHG